MTPPSAGPGERWILGIDVGGTKLAMAVGNDRGEVLARKRLPTPRSGDPDEDLAAWLRMGLALLEEANVELDALWRVGLSAPGPCDPERGTVDAPPNLPGWNDVQVRAPLERAFGCAVAMENDANAAALAEWRFGAGRGTRHMLYLTMSTGIGAGLVLDGHIHRGVSSAAGEVGHAPVEWDGAPCACGLRGCLEAYAGGRAWSARLRKMTPRESRVLALAGSRESITPVHVAEAARKGDAFALAEVDRYNEYLTRGLVGLAFTLAPEMIVLGTIPSALGESLCIGPVRQRVRERCWPVIARSLEIAPSALGERLPDLAGICAAIDGAVAEAD